jgi:hypothetical protein
VADVTATERDRLVALEAKVDNIDKKLDRVIDDHETRIRRLECKPAKRWDTVVAVIITAGVTTAINLLVTHLAR